MSMSEKDNNAELDFLGLGATVRGFVPGQRLLDRYVLQLVLGWSNRGVSWLALDEHLQKQVEIKFLPESVQGDSVSHEEISQAAHSGLKLIHPHIARLYDFFGDDSFAAIGMEYVDGVTLGEWRKCQPTGVFEVAHINEWTMQLLDALDYAHVEAKLIHGELNPYTLIGEQSGALKIVDFGIARAISDSLLRTGGRDGLTNERLVYMSPQMLAGESPTVLDDVYSLGATLYELLTSRPPFIDEERDLVEQIQWDVPPYMAQRLHALGIKTEIIPDEWELTIAACLVKQPASRPKSIAAVAERLGYKVAPIKVTTPIPAVVATPPPPPLRTPPPVSAPLIPTSPTPAPPLVTAPTPKAALPLLPPTQVAASSPTTASPPPVNKPPSTTAPASTVETKLIPKVERKVESKLVRRGEPRIERKLVPKPAPKEEPKLELKLEPAIEQKVESKEVSLLEEKPALNLNPKVELKPEAKSGSKLELKPGFLFRSKLTPKREPKVEPKTESKVEPAVDAKPEPNAQPKVDSKIEPKAEPKLEPVPVPEPELEPTVGSEPESKGVPELKPIVELKSEDKKEPALELPPIQSRPTKRLRKDRVIIIGLLAFFVLDCLGYYFFKLRPDAERSHQAELSSLEAKVEAEKRRADEVTAISDEEKAILIKAKEAAEARAQEAEEAARQARAEVEKTKRSALQELSTAMSPVAGKPWINSQGVKFVPAGTDGVLFSSWDVRVKDYSAFVTETGHQWPNAGFAQTENDPAVMVSWNDAKAYCDWLTKKEQADGRLSSNQAYRLPTDVEWSKAVGLIEPDASTPRDRNGDVRNVFPWGVQWFPPSMAGNYAELLTHDGYAKTSPVGSFSANGYGLFDMGGNVWQWCEDKVDYLHNWRVLRGASWVDHDEETLFSSCRSGADPDARDGNSGFRVVLVVSP